MPVVCKEIFVSRYYGNNLSSCGETIHTACKTIALATAQAQWNDTIYIDGTKTSRDPYPCSPMTSDPGGIYVNKSLSLKRFGNADVFVKCSSQMCFDGSNVSETVIIHLEGLTFLNSSVTVRRCSLYINSCLFTDAMSFPKAKAVVNFEAFQGQFSLTIWNSVFSNNAYPCILVVGNNPKIEINDTAFINNTASWESIKMVDVAVFMVLLTSQHILGEYSSSMTLTNISFIRNMAPFGGCLHIQTISVNDINAANRQTKVKRYKRNRSAIKDVSIIHQLYSTDYDTGQSTWGRISVIISGGKFHHNYGGAITVSRDVSVVNISIAKSNFINNSSPLEGGAVLVESSDEFILQIEDCKFVENSAKNEGSAIYVIAPVVPTKGSILVRNVLFLRNILHEPDFIDDFPSGGTLTIINFFEQGHLKFHLENVSFMYNMAAMGSSTLYSDVFFLEITIVDCYFLGNSQDERFSFDWKTFYIVSFQLNFTLINTIISGNTAKPRADNNTLEGQPIHFLVETFDLTRMNISGLQYKNNKGGGMYIKLVSTSAFFLQDSCFENNELFSLEIKADSNALLRLNRVLFTANAFVSSAFRSLALFFLYVTAQGNHITIEDTTFENSTVQGTIVLFRLPPDEKDPYACKIPRWDYKNQVRFLKVVFRESTPDTSVLRLENGWNLLSHCQFVDNLAAYYVFISESSTSLQLVNTSFEQTHNWITGTTGFHLYPKLMVSGGFRGFIYSASSGPIELKNTTLKVESSLDIDAYFMVTGASTARIDNSSIIQCPIGTLKTRTMFSHSRFVSNDACPNGLYNTLSQSFIFSCKRCSTGFYSVEPFSKKCRPCPFGGNCTSAIAAKPTFWGFPSLSDRGSISFQKCPINYCCPYRNISCAYDNQHYLSSGCSGNRTGFLCGECKPGFTETLFSALCRDNDVCTDYWFWPVALLYSMAFALFLLWKFPIIRLMKRLSPWGRPTPGGHIGADSTPNHYGGGYVKVVFYFYQVANLVFVSKNLEMHLADNNLLTPIIGWFDFKVISSNEGLVCPFRGLTVASKIFLQASQVFAVLSGILVIFLLHGTVRKLQKQTPAMPPSGQYLGAATECLLLGYSALASAALKALNCVEIQSTLRFFYDGNIQCWQWWQKLCGVFLSVFIIPFVFVLYFGSNLLNGKVISTKRFMCACIFPLPFAFLWMVSCKKNPLNEPENQRVSGEQTPLLPADLSVTRDEHCSHSPTDDVVYGPFKKCNDDQGPGAVYWESVLIGRRLLLISLHTFIVSPFIRMVCLSITCAAILGHHIWKKPFQNPRVNHAETASLTALLVLAVINMAEATLGINGELLSEQEHVCMTVLHVVEIIILGTVPVILFLVIVISILWQLIKFFQFCLTNFYQLLVN